MKDWEHYLYEKEAEEIIPGPRIQQIYKKSGSKINTKDISIILSQIKQTMDKWETKYEKEDIQNVIQTAIDLGALEIEMIDGGE